YNFPSNVNSMRVEFSIDSADSNCKPKKKSTSIPPCNHVGPCSLSPQDVQPNDTYYTEVMALLDSGIVSGYADHTYRPYNTVTRGQLAKIVVLAFNLPLVSGDGHSFNDIAGSPFASYIETAYAN